jgi:ubiquinone/menaquinone biosynthesis C-methylase UbiE/DNA-binding transcriptional ArsR family regulator
MIARASILDTLAALADSTRSRILLLLDGHELTVGELCAVLQLPQSTVSRHLKVLGDEQLVRSRADGTSRRYRMAPQQLDAATRRVWSAVREQMSASTGVAHDRARLAGVLADRRTRSQEFFSTRAGQWDRLRDELYGARADLLALPALLDDRATVGDLGCGTGRFSATVAPFVQRVIAVDDSTAMLAAARRRLEGMENVELRQGSLEALPLADGELDAAVLFLVLHHLPDPAGALHEAGRALAPGGRLLVVDMLPHERLDLREQMEHAWAGIPEDALRAWLHDAGFEGARYVPLPPDPQAKGPSLFACSARMPESHPE